VVAPLVPNNIAEIIAAPFLLVPVINYFLVLGIFDWGK
jgi:hypothetical protein